MLNVALVAMCVCTVLCPVAVAIDLTDHTSPYGSVHIRDKASVAERLAYAGIAVAYGESFCVCVCVCVCVCLFPVLVWIFRLHWAF